MAAWHTTTCEFGGDEYPCHIRATGDGLRVQIVGVAGGGEHENVTVNGKSYSIITRHHMPRRDVFSCYAVEIKKGVNKSAKEKR